MTLVQPSVIVFCSCSVWCPAVGGRYKAHRVAQAFEAAHIIRLTSKSPLVLLLVRNDKMFEVFQQVFQVSCFRTKMCAAPPGRTAAPHVCCCTRHGSYRSQYPPAPATRSPKPLNRAAAMYSNEKMACCRFLVIFSKVLRRPSLAEGSQQRGEGGGRPGRGERRPGVIIPVRRCNHGCGRLRHAPPRLPTMYDTE